MHTQPEGIVCALWTPIDAKGQILWDAIQKHLTFVLDSGVHGIMALGSTANFPFLTLENRKKVLEFIAAPCRERKVPIIVNVSDVSFRNVVELAEHARSCWVSGMAVLPPWYYGIEQRDMADFFIEVARRVPLPMALYNYPEMTGRKIEIETVRKVASTIQIFGFKQSGAEFSYHNELMELARAHKFGLFTGADTRLPEAAKIGAIGTISGLANAVPDVLARLWREIKAGKDQIQEAGIMKELANYMSELPYTLNVKAALHARGFETGEHPNPLSKETRQKYDDLVGRLKKFYTTNGLQH